MAEITKIIDILAGHLNASVFVLLVVLAVSYWTVHKVSYLAARWKYKEEDIAILKRKWDDDIPNIKTRVDLIFQKTYAQSAIQTSSPAKLTETGKDISDALDAEEFIKRFYKKLSSFVEKDNPQNAYDLQQACFSVVARELENLLSDEQLKTAKDKSLEYGIPLDNALAVFAVLLRDRLMKEKEWTLIIVAAKDRKFDFSKIDYSYKIKKLRDFLDIDGDFEYLDESEYTLIDKPKRQASGLIFAGYRNKDIWKTGIRPNTEHLSRVHRQLARRGKCPQLVKGDLI